MNSMITKGIEYKKLVCKGVKKATDIISLTYGYNGKYIKLNNAELPEENITNDGYKVAQQIYSSDPVEDIGCDIIRKTTQMIETKIKNGTTTTAILIGSLVENLVDLPEETNMLKVRSDIENLSNLAIEYATKNSVKIDNPYNVAFDSCHDKEMALFASKLLEEHDEFYEVSKSPSNEYSVDYNENKRSVPLKLLYSKGNTTIKDPFVVLADNPITSPMQIDALFNWLRGKDVVLVVRKIDDNATSYIKALIEKHDKNILFFATIDDKTSDALKNFYDSNPVLIANETAVIDVFKGIESVSSDSNFIGTIKTEKVLDKINVLKEQILNGHNDDAADSMRKKINNYSGRTYKVKLKSNSYNFKGQKDRFLDVINDLISLKKSEGLVVAGGGVIFKDVANYLESIKNDLNVKEQNTLKIYMDMLYAPLKEILRRGYVNDDISKYNGQNIGYDSRNECHTDMIKSGITTSLIAFTSIINVIKDMAIDLINIEASVFTNYDDEEER